MRRRLAEDRKRGSRGCIVHFGSRVVDGLFMRPASKSNDAQSRLRRPLVIQDASSAKGGTAIAMSSSSRSCSATSAFFYPTSTDLSSTASLSTPHAIPNSTTIAASSACADSTPERCYSLSAPRTLHSAYTTTLPPQMGWGGFAPKHRVGFKLRFRIFDSGILPKFCGLCGYGRGRFGRLYGCHQRGKAVADRRKGAGAGGGLNTQRRR
ncbi:hypothetical protein HYPSUDRAFT_206452 [Hypholoma sublateritium FD-334 SS-4]|uniref:Uncharacterized protein n=1 Tax=Hypholoma sublateritium (strain FD-334 SS-4) TaxID=945553 RepID=A0A0D2NDT7_HYPSF|nr:hypothetical protein HYPSUDRAFT_208556 [Hypholoma sublateritium FD-334 SS-4]KJA17184.1 hypothetical protein HYPSUDRAFT_206452 [Hypholoma sublateritium FD-334 SS-4]